MKTRIIHLDPARPDTKSIKAAISIINKGGLVAFPTETVYGIACIAQPDAIKRLDEIKSRPADKYYTVHIADKDDLSKYVPPSSISAAAFPHSPECACEKSEGNCESGSAGPR